MVDAAAKYRQEKEAAAAKGGSGSEEDPLAINGLIVVAGVNFGRGAPRDWATKGPLSLGVRVVLAVSFDPMYRWEIGPPGFAIMCFIFLLGLFFCAIHNNTDEIDRIYK